MSAPAALVLTEPDAAYTQTLHRALHGVADPMPKEITLVAFDPGGTTGWFLATFNPETGKIDTESIRYGQQGPRRHHGWLLTALESFTHDYPPLMIVTEDYRPEFARAQNYVALEYIGVMEAFTQNSLVSFERQGRDKKEYWTGEKMRKIGLWPHGMKHAQDACRHWLAYATSISRPLEVELSKALR